jgi:hypothetical protein
VSPASQSGACGETLTLSRQAIVSILVHTMGWEIDDAEIFWKLACREVQNPGCLKRERQEEWQVLRDSLLP